MTLAGDFRATRTNKKVEIATSVGLHNVVDIEPRPSARGNWLGFAPLSAAPSKLGVRNMKGEAT